MEITEPIIDAIKKLRKFQNFYFNEIPLWDLRIMKVNISEHSHRSYFLQYNTKSERYRLIVLSPEHQIKSREELTMKSNNNHSPAFKSSYLTSYKKNNKIENYRVSQIMSVLELLKNDNFWNDLNNLYEQTKIFENKYCKKQNNLSGGKKKLL